MSRVAVTPGKPASLGYRVYILLCPLRFRSALATRGEPRRYMVAVHYIYNKKMPPAPRFDRVQESAEGAAVRSLDGKLMRLAEARVPELGRNKGARWRG